VWPQTGKTGQEKNFVQQPFVQETTEKLNSVFISNLCILFLTSGSCGCCECDPQIKTLVYTWFKIFIASLSIALEYK
jgi:hypothetical protein